MTDSWQTIEQAAVSLRLSVRTVNRHMAAGKLQSRLSAEGRREVWVSLEETDTLVADTPAAAACATWVGSSANPTTSSSPFSQAPSPAIDPETVLALADNAAQKADMAVTAYQTLARLADTQRHQVRRQARFAWAAVAVMAVGITGAVGWATHRLTRATADVSHRSAQIEQLKQQVGDNAQAVRNESAKFETARAAMDASHAALRTELAAAREQAARAEGSLAAYKEQDQARQTREALAAIMPAPVATFSSPPSLERVLAKTVNPGGETAPVSDVERREAPDTDSARLASETSSAKTDRVTPPAPTTRPAPLRRKAAEPTTRPAPVSDAPTDSLD